MGDMPRLNLLKMPYALQWGIWLPWKYVLCYFDWCNFCMIHSLGPINVCTDFEINRYKIDEFRKHAKKIMFYLTSCDAKMVHRTSWVLCHF